MSAPFGGWQPLSPGEVVVLLAGYPSHWWVAGGHAIDAAAGHRVRDHEDIDVLVLHADHHLLPSVFDRWECWAADPPGTLRRWYGHEVLPARVHDLWCRRSATGPWQVQLLLDRSVGPVWVSRLNPRVRRPLDEVGFIGHDGAPYLRTEIQLFYKAQHTRMKDDVDFASVLGTLDQTQRAWLRTAIADTFGAHPWLALLDGAAPDR